MILGVHAQLTWSQGTYTTTGDWQAGKATHYGPYPQYPALSEAGYQPLDVGVGCSDGRPGGDPRWNAILKKGTKSNPLMNSTVWPTTPTGTTTKYSGSFGECMGRQ
ncbi:hypothetical protein EDD86DRAFT_210645 [Gorgonomyces haynaldii]|nr:hypothetical protein EDD86DRAFT_210645 [Gorgonomyces haynaldii]